MAVNRQIAPEEAAIGFERLDRSDVRRVGGKGANLGELTAAGLPVPPGFVVSASAYAAFCDGSGLRSRVAERLADVDVEDTMQLDRVATEVRSMIEAEPMPGWLEDAICEAYADLGGAGPNVAVAVRSSATAEMDIAVVVQRQVEAISVNIDAVERARRLIAAAEAKHPLDEGEGR